MDTAPHRPPSSSPTPQAGFAGVRCASYWNPQLLHSFSLLMAGRGCCVNESLLLCDAAYARGLLRRACTLQDQRLQQVAVDLLASMVHGETAPPPAATARPH